MKNFFKWGGILGVLAGSIMLAMPAWAAKPTIVSPASRVVKIWSNLELSGSGFATLGNRIFLGGQEYPFTYNSPNGTSLILPLIPFNACTAGNTCSLVVSNKNGTSNKIRLILTLPANATTTGAWSAKRLRQETVGSREVGLLTSVRAQIFNLELRLARLESLEKYGSERARQAERRDYLAARHKFEQLLTRFKKQSPTIANRLQTSFSEIQARLRTVYNRLTAASSSTVPVIISPVAPSTPVKTPAPLPDWLVNQITWSPGLLAGNRLSFIATVENSGTATGSIVNARLKIDDTAIMTAMVPAIEVGSTAKVSFDNAWLAIYGKHQMEVCVNYDRQLAEEDNTNNCAQFGFSVNN